MSKPTNLNIFFYINFYTISLTFGDKVGIFELCVEFDWIYFKKMYLDFWPPYALRRIIQIHANLKHSRHHCPLPKLTRKLKESSFGPCELFLHYSTFVKYKKILLPYYFTL